MLFLSIWIIATAFETLPMKSVQSFTAHIITGNRTDSSEVLKSQLKWPSLAHLSSCVSFWMAPQLYLMMILWHTQSPPFPTRTAIPFSSSMRGHRTTDPPLFIRLWINGTECQKLLPPCYCQQGFQAELMIGKTNVSNGIIIIPLFYCCTYSQL